MSRPARPQNVSDQHARLARRVAAAAVVLGAGLCAWLIHPLLERELRPRAEEQVADDAQHGTSVAAGQSVHQRVRNGDLDGLLAGDLDLQDLDAVVGGMTPIMNAASMGRADLVQALLDRGADPNRRGAAERTALQYAAERNHVEAARVLLAGGAQVDGADSSGLTPLIMAADRNYPQLALLLLDAGADVNHAMRSGYTALIDAAEIGNAELTRALLQRGADPEAKVNGWTAAALARRNGHGQVADLIEGWR